MFKLPVVKFFSRLVNRVTVTFLLILIELGWMLSVYQRLSDHLTWLNAAMIVVFTALGCVYNAFSYARVRRTNEDRTRRL